MSSYRVEWSTPAGELVAAVPSADEVATHAGALAAAYNDPRNAALLGNTELLGETDVIDYYAMMRAQSVPGFLFFRDGVLAGDGDLRHPARDASGATSEFAFLIAAPSAQGQGLGTRFATMVHALAFGELALDRVYASIVPANVASRRVFDKLGYTVDDSPAGRARAEDEGDLVLVIDRATFTRVHAAALGQIRISVR